MSLPQVPDLVPVQIDTDSVPDYSLAIIKDNIVYQVMNMDGQTAALLLSNPLFVQVDNTLVAVGDVYDPQTQTFSR